MNPLHMALFRGRYRVVRQLRATLYGGIYLCTDELLESRLVVLKRISLLRAMNTLDLRNPEAQAPDDPRQEKAFANLQRRIGPHAHITQYLDNFVQDDMLYFVIEYCDGGDLYESVNHGQNHALNCTDTLGVIEQIANGVAFLHENNVAHRDLSLENVMMKRGVCKIGDFGLATRIDRVCYERVGKAYYMAPEVVSRGVVHDLKATDVWSLGIVMFILVTGSPLVRMASARDPTFYAFSKVGAREVLGSWGMSALLWDSAIDLLDGMLQCNPAKRLTIQQVLNHSALIERAALLRAPT
ncbi:hypothetical protein BBJ28_00019539 [Nothophytophthora sp. Chile5]|nr:hypothetical protein BBJ28_00019539 [Nothophytophthora sp. Chile5]